MLLKTISFMLILICTTIFNASPTKSDELQTYIVHLCLPEGQEVSQPHKLEEVYNSYLSKIASGSNEKPTMVYPYRRVITGFAAKMSNEQAKVMENLGGVLLVSPERSYELHTTRFLDLHQKKGSTFIGHTTHSPSPHISPTILEEENSYTTLLEDKESEVMTDEDNDSTTQENDHIPFKQNKVNNVEMNDRDNFSDSNETILEDRDHIQHDYNANEHGSSEEDTDTEYEADNWYRQRYGI